MYFLGYYYKIPSIGAIRVKLRYGYYPFLSLMLFVLDLFSSWPDLKRSVFIFKK